VQDRQNRRVAGAVVRFVIRKTIRNRPIAVFQNGQGEIRTLTDAAGRASAGALQPVEAGSFEIEVDVSYQGQTAKAVIRNTNFPTAADARSAGREPAKSTSPTAQAVAPIVASPAGGAAAAAAAGGGMSKVAVVGLLAGGAAGAGAAVVLSQRASDSPAGTVGAVTASVTSGLQAATAFAFSVQATDFQASSLAYRWDFGDGGTSTDPAPTHVYASPGSYTVVVTVSDARQSARSELSVTVHTLTGMWVSTNLSTTLRLTQSGSTVTGSAALDVGVGYPDCPLAGSVQGGNPAIVLVQPPGCRSPFNGAMLVPFDYRLDLSPDGHTLSGTRVVPGRSELTDPAVFRR
jgi:hypothetical protein